MRVLVVEDEPYLADAVQRALRGAAIAADVARDGRSALERLDEHRYDVVVLDRDLPLVSGDEVAASIVARRLPSRIIMVTAADRLRDKADGFALGTDDYLTKPFAMQELVLRLHALARRPTTAVLPVLEHAGVRLDPRRREVHRDGRPVPLTRKQFAVLEVLMRTPGDVISAEDLLARAWDENADPFTNSVRITISALRRRLGDPWVVQTVPGSGYRFATPEDRPA